MSLRLRLILLALAVFLPALVAALWVINRAYDSERAGLERGLRETTRALSMVIDRELSQRETVARFLADSPTLDGAPNLTEADLRAFYEQARRATDNLDPAVLLGPPALIRQRTRTVLDQAGPIGHVFNLGHGILPQTPPDHARVLVDAVRECSSRRVA